MQTRADPEAMRSRARQYRAVADTHRDRAQWHRSTAPADAAAFGDINADVADLFEQVKTSQAEAWSALAERHDEHAAILEANAARYEATEAANTSRMSGFGPAH